MEKCPHCGWWLKAHQLALHLTFHLHADFCDDHPHAPTEEADTPRGGQHVIVNGRHPAADHRVQTSPPGSERRDSFQTTEAETRRTQQGL